MKIGKVRVQVIALRHCPCRLELSSFFYLVAINIDFLGVGGAGESHSHLDCLLAGETGWLTHF